MRDNSPTLSDADLYALIDALLRKEERHFPATDDEVTRFLAQTKPEPVSSELMDRILRRASGIAGGEQSEPETLGGTVEPSVEEEALAMYRRSDEKDLPPEVREKLDGIRKRLLSPNAEPTTPPKSPTDENA